MNASQLIANASAPHSANSGKAPILSPLSLPAHDTSAPITMAMTIAVMICALLRSVISASPYFL
jgi:hypothetical protein